MDTKTSIAVIILIILFLWHVKRAVTNYHYHKKRKKINYGKPYKHKK